MRIFLICLIFGIMGTILFHYYASYNWNYNGEAVVLTWDSLHQFVEITNVTLNGEIYRFDQHFLGDLSIGTIENGKYSPKQSERTKGMMRTMYRYYFDTMGETFFENKEIRKQFELKVEPAQVLWSSKKILKANMLQFCWFEYFGGKADLQSRIVGRFHFKKAGKNIFVIDTTNYLIVPGVSTRMGALAVLRENFDYLDWYGFESCYRHYPYPSEFDDTLSVEQKISQCKIPDEEISEMTKEQLLWAVIDFPFLEQINNFPTWEEKISFLMENCDAFKKCALDVSADDIVNLLKKAETLENTSKNSEQNIHNSINIGKQVGKMQDIFSKIKLIKDILLHCQGTYFDFNQLQLNFLYNY